MTLQFKQNLQQNLTARHLVPFQATTATAQIPHIPQLLCPEQLPYSPETLDSYTQDGNSQEALLMGSKKIQKSSARKEKYHVISDQIRLQLIDAVTNKGEKMKQAASRLGIDYSSAKSIFQVFKKEGRLNKKSSKNNKNKHRNSSKYDDSNDDDFPEGTSESRKGDSDDLSTKENLRESPVKPRKVPLELDSFDVRVPGPTTPTTCSSNSLMFSRISSGDMNLSGSQSPEKMPKLVMPEGLATKGAFSIFSGAKNPIFQAQNEPQILPLALGGLLENQFVPAHSLSQQLNQLNSMLVINRNQRLELLREQQKQLSLLSLGFGAIPDPVSTLRYVPAVPQLNAGLYRAYEESVVSIPPLNPKLYS